MRLITASHITTWAEREKRDCQGTLPILVRRLVSATAGSIASIDFPGGDAVSDEGWDGRLACASGSPYVPDGISGWEIGSDKSAGGKADKDYAKRSIDPLDLDPASTAYVFVTPRSWPKRYAWLQTRRAEGRWKDVRGFAAGDLEQWLERCPAVALWFARHLGIASSTAFEGIETWWAAWAACTRPAMAPSMLLGGRDREIAAAQAWMDGSATILEVQGDAPDEALAFLSAASTRWPETLRERFLARCVVTTTEEAFRAAVASPQPLAIAAYGDVAQSHAGLALDRGHHLYLAVGRSLATRSGGIVRLPRLDRLAMRQALIDAGLRREDAAGTVERCGRSIAVLHRLRSVITAVRRPHWASASRGKALVPALLAGAWSETVRPTEVTPFGPASSPLLDRAVLSDLAEGADYGSIVLPMAKAAAADDAPLQRAADVWRLTSPLDAWYLLADHLETSDLERLGTAAISVFAALDPKYELPEEEQWTAALHGKKRQHSEWLRQGMATSLAVVAHHGDGLGLPMPGGTAAVTVARFVERILSAFSTWQPWASLDDVLFLLAEASPEAVLSALEDFVVEHPVEVRSLLTDGGGNGLTAHCRHAGLLWSLERLAWQAEHLERCLVLLTQLDVLDPGGRMGNRPFATLCEILLGPGDPYTFSAPATCLAAVDAMIAESSATAWRLLLRRCEPLASRMVRDPPLYLPAKPDGWVPWTDKDRNGFWTGMQSRLVDLIAAGDRNRTVEALGRLEFLPETAQRTVLSRLEDPDFAPSLPDRSAIWDAVRGTLHRLRTHGDRGSLAKGVGEGIDRLLGMLTPSDPLDRVAWLFQQRMPQLPDVGSLDWAGYVRALEARRADAARSLLGSINLSELVDWAATLPDGYGFGTALADATDTSTDASLMEPLLALATADRDAVHPLLGAYVCRKLATLGRPWLDLWLAAAAARPEPAPALAALHCALPSTADTWRLSEARGSDVENLYWRWTWPFPDEAAESQDYAHALERLLSIGRVQDALLLVARPGGPVVPGQLLLRLARTLIEVLNAVGAQRSPNIGWEIEQLFVQIDRASDVAQGELLLIEWSYLTILAHTERGPRYLHMALASSPAFFAQLISLNYKRRDGAADPEYTEVLPAARAVRAREAAELLSSWKSPLPGESSAGLDGVMLKTWVVEARRLCAECDRGVVGDLAIGGLLARSPTDPDDGAWPHRAVRQVLATVRAEDLERGFDNGVFNGRGATMRGLLDGGILERQEADQYEAWATTIRRRFPYAARLLLRIAGDYRARAVGHDEQAAKNDLE